MGYKSDLRPEMYRPFSLSDVGAIFFDLCMVQNVHGGLGMLKLFLGPMTMNAGFTTVIYSQRWPFLAGTCTKTPHKNAQYQNKSGRHLQKVGDTFFASKVGS